MLIRKRMRNRIKGVRGKNYQPQLPLANFSAGRPDFNLNYSAILVENGL